MYLLVVIVIYVGFLGLGSGLIVGMYLVML